MPKPRCDTAVLEAGHHIQSFRWRAHPRSWCIVLGVHSRDDIVDFGCRTSAFNVSNHSKLHMQTFKVPSIPRQVHAQRPRDVEKHDRSVRGLLGVGSSCQPHDEKTNSGTVDICVGEKAPCRWSRLLWFHHHPTPLSTTSAAVGRGVQWLRSMPRTTTTLAFTVGAGIASFTVHVGITSSQSSYEMGANTRGRSLASARIARMKDAVTSAMNCTHISYCRRRSIWVDVGSIWAALKKSQEQRTATVASAKTWTNMAMRTVLCWATSSHTPVCTTCHP